MASIMNCLNCHDFTDSHIALLFHFPMLTYCKLTGSRGAGSVESVLTICNKLTCFGSIYYETSVILADKLLYCSREFYESNIYSWRTGAHYFICKDHAGIVSVIATSRKLLTLHIIAYSRV